jgi:rod shape determining protein RodA
MEPDFSSTLVLCLVILSLLFIGGANLLHLLILICYGGIVSMLAFLWTFLLLHPELAETSRLAAYCASISRFNTTLLLTLVGLLAIVYIAWRLAGWMRLNLSWVHFAIPFFILVAGLCSAVVINGHIKEYQRRRFMAFMDPSLDPQGVTYHVNQALVAIGSGGFWGKGIFSGTQSQLGFLPERHTDFIFAVIGEEMGFVGAAAVLGLYLLMLARMARAAEFARDRYGYLVCSGVGAMFGFYLLVNVGMCLGTLPVAGIPLPFVSYGGSNLVVNLWALGVVGNIYSKRYAFF